MLFRSIARLGVEQVDWVGTSLGGHIGMMLAAQHAPPHTATGTERFRSAHLVGCTSKNRRLPESSMALDSLEELDVHLRDALAPFGKLSDVEWRHLATHSAVPDEKGGWRFHYDPAIGHRFSIPMWLDVVLWPLWEEIECPVLVLRGEHSDLLSAETVQSMLERGPAAKAGKVTAVEFADCGHAPALMDPQQISVVREFLAEPSGTRIPRSAGSRRLRAAPTQVSLS